ncbi:MAG: hypothetical protein E6J91_38820 [Deltaproteobacteria bacterium]|nr:MAG: hypothetical protein E6J91_38820 [Deltaproteobacteria bacterium]
MVSQPEKPSLRAPVASARPCPTTNTGSANTAGPIPNTLPGRPIGVGPRRYQFWVTRYWLVKSRSPSSTSDGRYA